jgi:tRNA1Val (adenine37-N6)-methyltransferase
MIKLEDGERIDFVNDKLKLLQKPQGLTFGTDALLLAGYVNESGALGAELGSGSGIISMLLLTRDKLASATAIEVQEEYARLTERNAELNGLTDRLSTVLCDVRDFSSRESFDTVFTNPPYMKTTSGRANTHEAKNIARHEVCGDIADFCRSAKRILKYGGSFYAVYRPDRLTDLLCAMRDASLEPKRLTFVSADRGSAPSMVLVEGRMGGKSGCYATPPLLIYNDESHKDYTDDMNYIMENGSFPEKFTRR